MWNPEAGFWIVHQFYIQSTLPAIQMLFHLVQFERIAFKEYFFTCNLGPTFKTTLKFMQQIDVKNYQSVLPT